MKQCLRVISELLAVSPRFSIIRAANALAIDLSTKDKNFPSASNLWDIEFGGNCFCLFLLAGGFSQF